MPLDLPPLRTSDLDGPVAYREWDGPDGTTFVLLHGLGGSHLSWIQAAPGLAGLGRVVALDMPGFGRSPRAGRPTRLMDQRRILRRFLERHADGQVVLAGNSMGALVALLEAAMDPVAVGGVVLTSSPFPMLRGPFPNPLVLGAFAAYDVPRLGEFVVKTRNVALDPEPFVRAGLRILTSDPSSIPDDVIELNAELIADLRRDPEAPAAFLDAATIDHVLREEPVGGRAGDEQRPLSGVADPWTIGPVRARGVRGAGARHLPGVARPAARACGTRATDGGAVAVAHGGRRLVRVGPALTPC